MAGTARPFSVTTVIEPLDKLNLRNRQGARRPPEHQNNWDLTPKLFSYAIDEKALKQAQLMDGKLMLVTNVKDLNPTEVVQRDKGWPIVSVAAGS